MADHYGGKIKFSLILSNHAQNRIFPDRILAGSRFVKKNNLRIGDQSARQRRSSFACLRKVPTDIC